MDVGNAELIEQLHLKFVRDPSSVPPAWRHYFEQVKRADAPAGQEPSLDDIRRMMRERAHGATATRSVEPAAAPASSSLATEHIRKQASVLRLIHSYRLLGHHRAQVDPINLRGLPVVPDLDPAFHGLNEADLDTTFNVGNLFGKAEQPLREIIAMLKETYTEHIGAEFMHISDVNEKRWIQTRLESTRTNPDYPTDFKLRLLERLTAAEGMEQYLHTKYSGQKRFSLEGGETTITALDEIIHRAGTQGVEEIVIGMAHRGRLNVLINIMGKSPKELFAEFEGIHEWKGDLTGRREVSPGLLLRRADPGRHRASGLGLQPVPPGDREPGDLRLGAGPPGAAGRPRAQPGAGRADPRRRGLRRPGRGL
jgi:2-oxoglutarate dehydrogenase E1 component